MAKKVLTPEEVKAKMDKKSAKRKLFFGTFTKALAFFLAIAMAYSLATIAFTPATAPAGTAVQGGQQQSGEQGGSTSTDNGDDLGDVFGDSGSVSTPSGDSGSASTPSGDSGSASTPSGDSGSSSTGGQQSSGVSKADVVKAINDATAKAAKASYKWTRKSYYTKALEVDGKDALNTVIGMVDKSGTATVESVVGGFLDITGEDKEMTANVQNGQLADGMNNKDKFLLIASKLTESDIMGNNFKKDGNVYTIQLNACNRPQKDGSNALSRVTNDFITCDEVNQGLNDAGAGALIQASDINVTYKAILITAEIVDGKLVKYDITYTMDVTAMTLAVDLKLTKVEVGGSGAGKLECSYSDFKY